jgi:hypothetical protein
MVAVAIRDVDLVVRGVDRDVGGTHQQCLALVERCALPGAIGGVEVGLLADLEQQATAVVGVLLDDGVLVASHHTLPW